MFDFIEPHALNNGSCAVIGCWQRRKVPVQMRLDLTLRFHQETHAPLITGEPGNHAHRPSTGIKEWAQDAGFSTEFFNPTCTPSKMVALLPRCMVKYPPRLYIAGNGELALI
jgi:hypothetical protein